MMVYYVDCATVIQSVLPCVSTFSPPHWTGWQMWIKVNSLSKLDASEVRNMFSKLDLWQWRWKGHFVAWLPCYKRKSAPVVACEARLKPVQFAQCSISATILGFFFYFEVYFSQSPSKRQIIWKQQSALIDKSWIDCTVVFSHGWNDYGSLIKSCTEQTVEGSNFCGSEGWYIYSCTLCEF